MRPVDPGGAPLYGINPLVFETQKRWNLNPQASLDNLEELWAADRDWSSFAGPVTGPIAHRRWNSFKRWICHFLLEVTGAVFGGVGDVNSWSWAKLDRAEMACNLSDLSSISLVYWNRLCLHKHTKVLFCFKGDITNKISESNVWSFWPNI